jgi:NADH-quinone oxidoreductase subunit G
MSIKITVDGKTIETEEGRQLIDVLNENGFDIPHFCYHPGLGPDGNCRMCQVEIKTPRGPLLTISCNTKVNDGMEVETRSEKVLRVRAAVEEFLLLNHPLDCPICDKAGECTLQNYYMQHDQKDGKQEFVRFKKNKAEDIGPTMILDQERCVLCNRCVRFLRDWAGEEQLYIAGRGHSAFLTKFPGKEVDSPYSLNTVDLCPVGALTSKDFRFSTPTWFLKRTPSVCTTCSRGCSIEVDVDTRDNKVKRLRPRHNPDVNGYWMCDEGRLNYQFVNTDRIAVCRVDRKGEKYEASMENALNEVGSILRDGGRKLAVLVSATATVEEMYACKKLGAAYAGSTVHVVRHVPDGVEDELLRKADRHPNLRGAEMLGLGILDFVSGDGAEMGGDIPDDAVVLGVGFDYDVPESLGKVFGKFSQIVIIAARESELTGMAHVLMPGLTFAEKEGLVVNFDGHIQALNPALDGLWDKMSPWQIIAEVTSKITGEAGFDSVSGLRSQLGKDEPAFAGVDLNNLGATGAKSTSQPA